MANQSGSVYGLTILSPIARSAHGSESHSLAIRQCLEKLPRGADSPFAKVSSTHMARLVVMDDVVYFGRPSREEHLRSKYLIFESNFDGDLDPYLRRLAVEVPQEVHAVWRHCEGYPGVENVDAFIRYMKRCQVETTFFFADVNDKTVQQTLQALQTQSAVTAFIEKNQGKPAEELQRAFVKFIDSLQSAPPPVPGIVQGRELADE